MLGGRLRVDIDLAVGDKAEAAEDVVRMIVRVDQSRDRLVRDLRKRRAHLLRGLARGHHIDDEHAVVALDHDRVREAEADRLIDTVGYRVDRPLKLGIVGDQLRVDLSDGRAFGGIFGRPTGRLTAAG